MGAPTPQSMGATLQSQPAQALAPWAGASFFYNPQGQLVSFDQLPKDAQGNVQFLGSPGGASGGVIPLTVNQNVTDSSGNVVQSFSTPAEAQAALDKQQYTASGQAIPDALSGTALVPQFTDATNTSGDGSFLGKYGWAIPFAAAGAGALAAGGAGGAAGGSAAGWGAPATASEFGGAPLDGSAIDTFASGSGADGFGGAGAAGGTAPAGTAVPGAGTAGTISASTPAAYNAAAAGGGGAGSLFGGAGATLAGVLPAVAGLAGAAIQSHAAQSAAQTQANSAAAANQTLADEFNTINAQQAPYRAAGTSALSQLLTEYGLSGGDTTSASFGSANKQFDPATALKNDPGLQFQTQQANQLTNQNAAARGNFFSTQALADASKQNQGITSQYMNDAYNRFNTDRNFQVNGLQSLAGVGQTAVQNTGAAGSATAGAISQNQTGTGNALAAGQIGSGNAWSNALSGISNNITQQSLINALLNKGSGT